MNWKRPTAITSTMNDAKTSFSREILASAMISVVQYLAPLQYTFRHPSTGMTLEPQPADVPSKELRIRFTARAPSVSSRGLLSPSQKIQDGFEHQRKHRQLEVDPAFLEYYLICTLPIMPSCSLFADSYLMSVLRHNSYPYFQLQMKIP
jgi:hypothetical protein